MRFPYMCNGVQSREYVNSVSGKLCHWKVIYKHLSTINIAQSVTNITPTNNTPSNPPLTHPVTDTSKAQSVTNTSKAQS